MNIHDTSGHPLDATVGITILNGFYDITFESKSGTPSRNSQYNEAVSTVIQRLAACNFTIDGVFLASAKVSNVPEISRLVVLQNNSYPLELADIDLEDLRVSIGREISKMFREPSASGGGNAQRRMTIRVPVNDCNEQEFRRLILFGPLANIQVQADTDVTDFDPSNTEDTRQREIRAIAVRRGQQQFRNRLLLAYCHRCAITGSTTDAVLEAAHIIPYRGSQTNYPSNGLLLRADVHTLFDIGYITVTQEFIVKVSEELRGSEYWMFNGIVINLPNEPHLRPSKAALSMREAEGLRQNNFSPRLVAS